MEPEKNPGKRSETLENDDFPPNSVWIFGYGSLLWKVNFPYQAKLVGYVKGYSRRFWQGSTDHRGVPGAETTWGVAYKVDPNDITEVLAYLNHREKCGYTTKELLFYPNMDIMDPFPTLMYIGTATNPMFLGPASTEEIAQQVVNARGASGCNTEYVLNLARAMREIAPLAHDEHLFSLERKINEMVANSMQERQGGDRVKGGCGVRVSEGSRECTCFVNCDMVRTG